MGKKPESTSTGVAKGIVYGFLVIVGILVLIGFINGATGG